MSTEPSTTNGESDASPYIRTFAKDYAALSGKKPQVDAKPEPKSKPKKESRAKKKKNERRKEAIEQSSEISRQGDTIEEAIGKAIPTIPVSTKPEVESFTLPRIAAGDIVPQDASERASILARLKARALEDADIGPTIEPIAPVPLAKDSKEETPSPLHTYKTDFSDHIKDEHASAFSVIAAEKDAPAPKPKPAPRKRNYTNTLAIALGVVLLMAGAGGIYAAYLYVSKNAPVVSIITPASLITPDSSVLLSGSGSELLGALAQQANQPLADNAVVLTYVNESTTTGQGVTQEPSTGGAFISELNLQAPDILFRNIDPSSMVGIVSTNGEAHPFFILRVTSYERTFAGMLEWEPVLYGQLSLLYPEYPAPVVQAQPISTTSSTVSTTTKKSTSKTSTVSAVPKIIVPTAPILSPNAPAQGFIDEAVASHVTRALKDNSGRTLVLYGYADKQTLIIARNEAAFTVLLNRLEANAK